MANWERGFVFFLQNTIYKLVLYMVSHWVGCHCQFTNWLRVHQTVPTSKSREVTPSSVSPPPRRQQSVAGTVGHVSLVARRCSLDTDDDIPSLTYLIRSVSQLKHVRLASLMPLSPFSLSPKKLPAFCHVTRATNSTYT